jgi:hypothetical protein
MAHLSLGFHVISGEHFVELLRRAYAGEDPELVYVEEYVNADHKHIEEEGTMTEDKALEWTKVFSTWILETFIEMDPLDAWAIGAEALKRLDLAPPEWKT